MSGKVEEERMEGERVGKAAEEAALTRVHLDDVHIQLEILLHETGGTL